MWDDGIFLKDSKLVFDYVVIKVTFFKFYMWKFLSTKEVVYNVSIKVTSGKDSF